MGLIFDQSLHHTDYPSKRFKLYDGDDDDTDEQLPSLASPKQIPIYRGPGVGNGLTYFCMLATSASDNVYDHTIYFKNDSFTVREDMGIWIEEEDKHKRPVDDTTIRSVWDPKNKDFLESLMNEECPAEFTEGRQGDHYIHIFGLRDDQDLKEPSTPPQCFHLCSFGEDFRI